MHKRLVSFQVFLVLMLMLSACNMPAGEQTTPTSEVDVLNTAAAQTVVALSTKLAVVEPTQTPMVVTATASQMSETPTETLPAQATAVPTNTSGAIVTSTNIPITSVASLAPTAIPATAVPVPCDRAGFVSDVTVGDNTVFSPGSTFVKTWRLQNTGSCTWTSSYQLVFDSGNAMGGPTAVGLPGTVAPGQTVDLSVTLVAPASTGTYQGFWKLQNASGARFGIGANAGTAFWVKIIVGGTGVPTTTVTTTSGLGCSVTLVGPTNYSEFLPNASFDGRWTLKNTGTDAWDDASMDFRYIGGTKMHEGDDAVDLWTDVASGDSIDFVRDMVAPSSVGTYSTSWALVSGSSTICSMTFTVRVTN
ncbi:MAG: NBR1-Ig-like domain-containing protein [Anaerolineaceae bacterium]|nr:NBR1-Ig-like domain-containing protein [Anaerolineaceae bacterium]